MNTIYRIYETGRIEVISWTCQSGCIMIWYYNVWQARPYRIDMHDNYFDFIDSIVIPGKYKILNRTITMPAVQLFTSDRNKTKSIDNGGVQG